jgi:medium-chain acyl-[acyl-carrier-protein] hydrolase
MFKWMPNWRPIPLTSSRLFCFPFAAAAWNVYRPWRDDLARLAVELCPIEMPGHLQRRSEESFTGFEQLLDDLTPGLIELMDRPYSLFGYSMGALVAFELARRLRRIGGPMPAHLVVAACAAPQMQEAGWIGPEVSDDDLIELVASRFGQLPKYVIEDHSMRELVLDMLRKDLTLVAGYRYQAEPPLSCPLLALGGRDDRSVTMEALVGWREQSLHSRCRVIDGDHAATPSRLSIILEELCTVVSGARPSAARADS